MHREYLETEKSRRDRSYNIAVAILELTAQYPDSTGITIQRLRRHILERLGRPTELEFGDLSATGDAVGRRSLRLETEQTYVRGRVVRVILFNEANTTKCLQFLENGESEDTNEELRGVLR